jgi:hypothetical protein
MHVPPSSGDCGPGLDPSAPVMASRRSLNRWQHPEVIENSNRHEPTRLTKSANGSRANRADEQMSGRASGAMRLHRRRRTCHSLVTHCVPSEPPVKASLRLACSLRSRRSALTGPGSDVGPISEMREWQAWLFRRRKTKTQFSLDTDRPSHGSPGREHWERREGQASPGTGRKNWRRVLLSPRSGACQLAMPTQGSRPGLFSFALRASGTLFFVAATQPE